MDMTRCHAEIMQQNHPGNPSAQQANIPQRMTLREKLFHTNWGIALIGVLVGLGILVATLHTGGQAPVISDTATPADIVVAEQA